MGRFHPPRDEALYDETHPDPGGEVFDEPWDRRRRRIFRPGEWHRRVRALRMGGIFGRMFILDGGRDEPLDRRGLEVWHLLLVAVVVVGIVTVLVARS